MDVERTKLLVIDEEKFKGLITIGDIQRAILKDVDLSKQISNILDRAKEYVSEYDTLEAIKSRMNRLRTECMPVVNASGDLVEVYFWEDFFPSEDIQSKRKLIDLPVVIMAGGKGTRLKPITNVIPKPLIPVGDKTILEVIMDQFEGIGCHKFYMSVNYKSDIMRFYLDQLPHKYDIEFF